MATLQSGLRVPLEVLSVVLQNVADTRFLARASLVSRAWYTLAFPYLHRVMFVKNIETLDALTRRLESETNESVLRIGLCVWTLRIFALHDFLDVDQNKPVTCRFQVVLHKLERLKNLEWSGEYLSDSTGFF